MFFKKKKTQQVDVEKVFLQVDDITQNLLKKNEKILKNLLTNGTDASIIDNR